MRRSRVHCCLALCGTLLSVPALGQSPAKVAPSQVLGGFPDWTTSVAISPDGRILAAGSYDEVQLWSLADKSKLGTLSTRCGFAQTLAFTHGGQQLIVGGYQQVQLWDVGTLKLSATLKGHKGYVRDLAVSPSSAELATASEDQTVRVWRLETREPVRQIGPLENPVLGVAWAPNGEWLATAEGDETRLTRTGLVTLWNAASGERVADLPPHTMGATDVAFAPDGKTLLSTSLDEHVNVYDVAGRKAIGFFGGHSRPTNCVVLTPDGRVAISGSGGRFQGKNEIKLFTPSDGGELGTLEFHEGKVTALALSADGRTLASASYDKSVAIWDLSVLLPRPAENDGQALPIAAQLAVEPDTTPAEPDIMRIGIIGLDTSHAVAFTKLFNAAEPVPALRGFRVVAAYPQGSPDIESSTSRVPQYTEEVRKLGVEIVASIDLLVEQVDAVLLETNDGRPHLQQVLPVLAAHKPVFVDKPIAASLEEAIAILEAARHYGTPCFSASSLRWIGEAGAVRAGEHGAVLGCDAYSPCALEPTHPDLYWYGIHGVETLFTVMGTGLETVSRSSTENFELATGVWAGGRIGTFRGCRAGARGYGGTAFCERKTVSLGPYPGYQPLVEQIAKFFRTGETPVSAEETIEIYTFMSAADESKRQGGLPVNAIALREQAYRDAQVQLRQLVPGYQPAQ